MKTNNKSSYILMIWMKSDRKHFKELPSFKKREQNGMTSILKRKKFNWEIGPCCMTTGSRTSKES
jgi:hypothetical protein